MLRCWMRWLMRFCKALIVAAVCAANSFAQTKTIEDVNRAIDEESVLRAFEQSTSAASLRKQLKSENQLAGVILGDPAAHAHIGASHALVLDEERKSLQSAVRDELTSFA